MESVPVLGRTLVAGISTPELRAWLHEQWSFPEHVLPSVPYAIHLQERDAPPAPLEGTPVTVPLHRTALSGLAALGTWSFGDGTEGVQLRLEDGGSRIDIWGVGRQRAAAATLAALYLAVAESLRASGLLPLHAAVAVRDGRATALAGRSGVGKSTTLLRAMDAGWAPLAEDLAWLDTTSDVVYGWDRGLRLHPDARERFAPALPRERLRTDPDGKLFVPYDGLSCARVGVAKLVRLALLEREAAGGRDAPCADPGSLLSSGVLAPLGRAAMVRAWWEAIGVPLSAAVRQRVAAEVARLTQRVEAVRLPLDEASPPRDIPREGS